MLDRSEGPGGWELRGDLVCVLCGRTAARAQGPRAQRFTATAIRIQAPEHAETVRRMRCPHCAGALSLQNLEEVYVDRRPLTADEMRPRRGRPPKVRADS